MTRSTLRTNRLCKAAITAILIVAVFAASFILSGQTVMAASKALTVKVNGVTKKTYTMAQLKKLSTSKRYNYSAWNTFPSNSSVTKVSGPTVEAILKNAGVLKKVKDNGTVSFNGNGYVMKLTGAQLLKEKRYYYPNANLVDQETGVVPKDAYEGKKKVPAIISLKNGGCLYVGQVAPNEENKPLFVQEMASGGIINISTTKAAKCDPIKLSVKSGSLQKLGTELIIESKEGSNTDWEYDKIYYTFGKTASPGYGKAIYNCGPKQDMECRPVLNNAGVITLKVRVKGYGKLDSTLQTFTIYVGDALTVKLNGNVIKTYETVDDFKAAADPVTYTYSGYNTYPSLSFKNDVTGIKIEDILNSAGFNDYDKSGTIKFVSGADGYEAVFTLQQMFGDKRYYFPNAKQGTNNKGAVCTEAAYEGMQEVAAIIETTGTNNLEFGQVAPSEQNFAECVDNMLTLGVIEINTTDAPKKCATLGASSPASGSKVKVGEKIKLPYPTKANKRVRVYYIIDPEPGEEPGIDSAIYNYSPNRWSKKLVNAPVFKTKGKHIIVARNISYGKLDGDITTYVFNVK